MAGVSPPPHDALELGPAPMEVMRGTAVSFPLILIVASSCDINASIVAISLYLIFTICTASCQSRAFLCSNGQCVRSSDRCDGIRDCTDGSDETGCSSTAGMLGKL